MTTKGYELRGVDNYVLSAVEQGKVTLSAILYAVLEAAPCTLKEAQERTGGTLPGSRVIDRSLQRMRHAGLIQYSRADGWRLS